MPDRASPLNLMVYDRTCTSGLGPIGLTHSWIAGARLYGWMGRFDATFPAAGWPEALDWLATVSPERAIASIQFWGHGTRGRALVAGNSLDATALPGGPLHGPLARIRARMSADSLWWFRTCDTFGGDAGHDFARRWTDFFGCSAAGHTHIIGPWQSGLHRVLPGTKPRWSAAEGVASGTPSAPTSSTQSAPWLPHTITCLRGDVPAGW